jgi:hypothetical protein
MNWREFWKNALMALQESDGDVSNGGMCITKKLM